MNLLNYFFINNLRKRKWCAGLLDLTSSTCWLILSSIYSVFQETFHHLSIFYSKLAVLEVPLLWTGLQLAQVYLGNKQDSLHELNSLDLCVIDKNVWLLYFICPSGIKDVRIMRRDGSITSNNQITEISCVLKIIANFCVWQRVPEEVSS